jgi:hypothetical protein
VRLLTTSVLLLMACSTRAPAPVLEQVSPATTTPSVATVLSLVGSNLMPAVTLDFDRPSHSVVDQVFSASVDGPAALPLSDVAWLDATHVQATLVAGAPLGVYSLTLVTPLGSSTLMNALTVSLGPCSGCDGGVDDGGQLDGGDDAGTPCGTLTWADEDGDGFGDPNTGALLCGPTRATNMLDCNDLDPAVHPGATERCNQVDDNCNGVVDEGACDGGASWGNRDAGTTDWQTASSWQRDAVWIAGSNQAWVHNPGLPFVDESANCSNGLMASWAWQGDAWLGSTANNNGRTALHPNGASGCTPAGSANSAVVGLVGFASPDGGIEVRGVERNGDVLFWSGPSGFSVRGQAGGNALFEDLHGVDPLTLYAVGTDTDQGSMKAWRWTSSGWVDEHVGSLPGMRNGTLHGVWVLSSDNVFAVGDNGVVLERFNGAWHRLPSAGGTLQAVRAFARGHVYVVSSEGLISHWNGSQWSVLYDGGVGHGYADLTATSDEDLWAVGRAGTVTHWPE